MKTSVCLGDCTIFNLTLYHIGKGDLKGINFTKAKSKSLKILSLNIFQELSDLANNINI
uniref:DUF6438 domain-containing protein n=1 Tax=Pedobacter agri TaxID=454586 RepID=UPI003743072A